ncbi:MAG: 30S ribosomal protein S17 [Terriglobales bacterium]|jgi:small subunit ribosomal protein S17
MAEQAKRAQAQKTDSHRNEKIGYVTSTKMAKTIVVEVKMRKAHRKYKRVIGKTSKFYAHDDQNTAHTGDVVRIVETRPLSKLKRWRLAEVIQRAAIVPGSEKIEQAS